MVKRIYQTVNAESARKKRFFGEFSRKGGCMQNGGMLLILLLLLIYTFGGDGELTSENLTLIVLALAFLVSGSDANGTNSCGCGLRN